MAGAHVDLHHLFSIISIIVSIEYRCWYIVEFCWPNIGYKMLPNPEDKEIKGVVLVKHSVGWPQCSMEIERIRIG